MSALAISSAAPAPVAPLSERAMLATLNIRNWTARKLDKKATNDVHELNNAAEGTGRYNKLLVSKESLADIVRITNKAREVFYHYTSPWMYEGPNILAAALYMECNAKLRELRIAHGEAVAAFLDRYPAEIERARALHGSLFNPADYPTAAQVSRSFHFDFAVMPMPDSRDFRVDLGNGQADAIRADIEERVQTAFMNATRNSFERIAELVGRMVERLKSYKPATEESRAEGVFRDSLVDNLRDLAKVLPGLNFTGNADLARITQRIESELCYWDADALRNDPDARKDTAAKAESILADLSGFIS